MLRAVGGPPGDRTVVLGLSEVNLQRLRAGQPILADLGPLGVPGVRVVLFWGPTEEQMEATLAPLLQGAERRGPGPLPGTQP